MDASEIKDSILGMPPQQRLTRSPAREGLNSPRNYPRQGLRLMPGLNDDFSAEGGVQTFPSKTYNVCFLRALTGLFVVSIVATPALQSKAQGQNPCASLSITLGVAIQAESIQTKKVMALMEEILPLSTSNPKKYKSKMENTMCPAINMALHSLEEAAKAAEARDFCYASLGITSNTETIRKALMAKIDSAIKLAAMCEARHKE